MDAGLHLGAEEPVDEPMPGQLFEPVKRWRDDGDTVVPASGHRPRMTRVKEALVDDLQVNGVEPGGQFPSDDIGHRREGHEAIITSMAPEGRRRAGG